VARAHELYNKQVI